MLVPHFPEVMDVEFTAQIEESLDKIEEGDRGLGGRRCRLLQGVRQATSPSAGKKMENFKEGVDDGRGLPGLRQAPGGEVGALRQVPRVLGLSRVQVHQGPRAAASGRADEPTDEICPTCGKPMVIKHGRFGKFIACSGYPECKTTKPVTLGIACPRRMRGPAGGAAHASGARPSTRARTTPSAPSSVWQRPVARAVPQVRRAVPHRARGRGGKITRACVKDGCGYKDEVAPTVA